MARRAKTEEPADQGAEIRRLRAEVRRLEAEAAQAEHFKHLFDEAPLPYQALDENGVLVDLNTTWTTVMGYSREEALGRSFGDFQAPQSRKQFKKRFEGFKRSGSIDKAEMTLLRKDGEAILVSLDGRIDRHPDGSFHKTHCLWRDITRERAMEEALAHSEQALRTLIDSSRDYVLLLSPKGRIITANTHFVERFGNGRSTVEGCSVYELFPPDVAEKRQDALRKVVRTKQSVVYRDENQDRCLDTTLCPVLDDKGRVWRVAVFSRDVTEEHERERALRESEEKYRLLADNIADVVWTLDANHRMTYISPSVTAMRGFTPEELLDIPIEKSMTPQSLEKARQAIALREEQERLGNLEHVNRIEVEQYHKLGGTIWVEMLIKALYDEEGRRTGFIGMSREVTQRKHAQQALVRSEAKFRQVMEQIQLVGVSLDPMGRLSFANDYFLGLTGWTREEVIGRDWFETFIPGDIADEIRKVFLSTIGSCEAGQYTFYENDILTRDGEVLHVGWTNVLTLDETGAVIDVTCVGLDLTERKRAMAALRESEDRFRSIVQNSPMGIHLYELRADGDLVFIGANNAADRFTGVNNASRIGLSIEEAFPQHKTTEIPDRYRRIARHGETWYAPRYRYDDGDIQGWFDVYAFQTSPRRMAAMFLDVTDQVRAEEALRSSESLYRKLFENAAVGVFLADNENTILEANSLACDILGYGGDELRGKNANSILLLDKTEMSPEEASTRARDHGEIFRLERTFKRKDGSILPVEVHIRSVDETGNHLVMFQDISARKKAERTLTDFKRLMDAMADTMADMLWAKDRKGRYIFANRAIRENLLCADDIDAIGKTDLFFTQRQRDLGKVHTFGECCVDSDEVVLSTGRPGRFVEDGEVRGKYLCLDVLKSPLFDARGALIGTVGTGRDITEQREAEQELRRSRSLLEESQRMGGMGGFEVDVKTQKVLWTEGEYETYGLDPAEPAPGPYTFLTTCVHHEDRKPLRDEWRRAVDRRSPVRGQFRALHQDGSQRLIRYIAMPQENDTGDVTHLIGVTRDVTEEMAAQTALMDAKEAAEKASHAKSEFLANMSHELRTPLNGIFGMLQLALTTELDEEQREYVETALATGRSLLTVINDVLDFSKLDAGYLEIDLEPFDLRENVSMVMNNFRIPAMERGLELNTHIDDSLPVVLRGDAARMRQILFNLVGNAVKFTPEGGVTLEVDPLPITFPGQLRLLFTITDTGIGIPESHLGTIFDAFTQVDGAYTRKFTGTGLGLGIVKRLVQLMGGNLSIASAPGEGTQIHFTLPVREAKGHRPARPDPASRPGPPTGNLSILLAEDEIVNQLAARLMLEKQGHTVTCASNGLQAVQAVREGRFDCVLMDIQMPEMDGLRATQAIRAIHPKLPIIAMTAHAMTGDRDRILAAGLDDYIAKPVDAKELDRILERLGRKGEKRAGPEVSPGAEGTDA